MTKAQAIIFISSAYRTYLGDETNLYKVVLKAGALASTVIII